MFGSFPRRESPHSFCDAHERFFLDRLEKIRGWSRNITGGDPHASEDLVQDVFLHFTTVRPDLRRIVNPDTFLYVVIRNLYRSQLSAAQRRRQVPLDVMMHDSAESSLGVLSAWERLVARSQLAFLCSYVCERKSSSKSACALILRFFHGYSVRDTARILGTTRGAVDERLRQIRREVRDVLTRPPEPRYTLPALLPADTDEDLLRALRERIFDAVNGDCLTAAELREYDRGTHELPVARLGHLVSCRDCLHTVESMTGSGDGGSGTSSGIAATIADRWRKRREELLGERPVHLRVAVNGQVVGTEAIHGGQSEFSVHVSLPESIEFVELHTERDVRLLMLTVAGRPPAGEFEQTARLTMSEGRTLTLRIRFEEPWPIVQVMYCTSERKAATALAVAQPESRRHPLQRRRWWPAVSGVTAVLLVMLLITTQMQQSRLSAAAVLTAVSQWERSRVDGKNQVLYRRFQLTEKDRWSGRVKVRRSVEVWRKPAEQRRASRLLDEQGRVLSSVPPSAFRAPLSSGTAWQYEPSGDLFRDLSIGFDQVSVRASGQRLLLEAGPAILECERSTSRPAASRVVVNDSEFAFEEQESTVLAPPLTPFGSAQSAPAAPATPVLATPAGLIADPELPEIQVRFRLWQHRWIHAAVFRRTREGLEVEFSGIDSREAPLVREALSGIAGLSIRLVDAADAVANSRPAEFRENADRSRVLTPLLDERLASWFGSVKLAEAEGSRIMDSANGLVREAASLRELSDRYPEGVEAGLAPAARAELHGLVYAVTRSLDGRLRQQEETLQPLLGQVPGGAADTVAARGRWQVPARRTEHLAWKLERLLARLLTTIASDEEGRESLTADEALASYRDTMRALAAAIGACRP